MDTKKQSKVRIRPAVAELQHAYDTGNKKPLEDLMRAWKGIKELPPEDPNSFFKLGGFHGEPFVGAGWGNSAYWGGWCNHGNVLFPTWHRVYLIKVEEALQSIPGCEDVMLPYWDESSEDSIKNGIPKALTDETFTLDGKDIPNPLRSFVFPINIHDNIQSDNNQYTKPKGYETVRYPLSGLVGTDSDRAATKKHNAQFTDYTKNVALLNDNVKGWLNSHVVVNGKVIQTNVVQKFKDCLKAPNFTVFSNTTSAQEWNFYVEDGSKPVVPLESPHNSIHLSVGGFDVPTQGNYSPIPGANGDMGENNTAGLDPIFFFHHCNVDRVFWLWQKQHGSTDTLEIISEYPGTNSVDSQGPTPGMTPNAWLTLETPLAPFKKKDGQDYTSLDCINIETQLGLTYSRGSLDNNGLLLKEEALRPSKMLRVSGVNKAPIRGSFLISAFATINGEKHHIGTEAVLSRWNSTSCANCQTHLEVKAHFPLHDLAENTADKAAYEVVIIGRDGNLNEQNQLKASKAAEPKKLFHMEVR
ncbi:tyrosinase family protein [Lacinutrix neustonica]|uniref:Tyrosinase family protein n=1 Tax=Lacinutrix neustonica TaxID=2980107 RepID=A0A9E8SDB5_9FLAO|nr:tyrosinase family protein [Lacinutrix neustonica]WAC02253.1 tyrosinase family protein [Lacinutrix neustonica]